MVNVVASHVILFYNIETFLLINIFCYSRSKWNMQNKMLHFDTIRITVVLKPAKHNLLIEINVVDYNIYSIKDSRIQCKCASTYVGAYTYGFISAECNVRLFYQSPAMRFFATITIFETRGRQLIVFETIIWLK